MHKKDLLHRRHHLIRGGLKMQFGRTENANAKKAKKKCKKSAKKCKKMQLTREKGGLRQKKAVQKASNFFSGVFGAG